MRTAMLIVCVLVVLAAAFLAVTGGALPGATPARGASPGQAVAADKGTVQPDTYIVVLDEEPLASYEGGTAGLPATSPTVTGVRRLDPDAPASQAYLDHLDAAQARARAAVDRALGRAVDVGFRYRYVLDGFSVRVTPAEAARLRGLAGIAQVTASRIMALDTDAGPAWIGAPPVWDGSALGRDVGTMGEGIVVGLVDTGINIDHPSFAAVDKYGYEHRNPKGKYLGFCDPDNPHYDAKWACNDKLIGLYSFIDEPPGNSFVPEDGAGHGSHTASTVAGNFVSVQLHSPTLTITREISGVAPHANIVAYDACGGAGCPDEATLAALDQAVADQVDVVNYSISTSRDAPWTQPVMQAFYRVRKAGIYAAVSAGNNGPGASTTGALPPWVTAVAAGTHDRVFLNKLVDLSGGDLPSPGDLSGGSLTAAYGPASIVYAGDGSYTNVSGAVDDGMCNQPFPADTWQGQIVVCDRGVIARLDKATNVQAGGAGGLVLVNQESDGQALMFDGFAIPGLQLGFAEGARLKAWLAAGSGQTARISGTQAVLDPTKGDVTAGFSSRGPALAGACCRRPDVGIQYSRLFGLLKPDVMAPGVDVLAAVASPEGSTEPEFDRYSGTSMSGPHVAGAAALVLAARPSWTVAEVQSALMTTAITSTVRKEDGVTPADPFDRGAGRVQVDHAVAAGLVLDATPEQMDAADPVKGGDVRQLNLASMADPFCLSDCGWTRVVSGTLDHAMGWTASVQVDPQFAAMQLTVAPQRFRLAPGRRQSISVDAFVDDLPAEEWAFGQVLLVPDDPSIPPAHFPVAVRPVRADVPPVHTAYGESASGTSVLPGVRTAANGPLRLDVSGMARGTTYSFSLAQDPTPNVRLDLITGTQLITIPVPVPARRIVVEVDASQAEDVDLFVGVDANGDGLPQDNELRCTSASETWTEYCELQSTDPDQLYWAVVQNYTASADAPDDITVVTGVVPAADAGNLTVTAPDTLVPGQPFDLTFHWSLPDFQPGDTWFSLVDVGSGPDSPGDLGHVAFDLVGRMVSPTPTPPPTPEPTTDPAQLAIWMPVAVRGPLR